MPKPGRALKIRKRRNTQSDFFGAFGLKKSHGFEQEELARPRRRVDPPNEVDQIPTLPGPDRNPRDKREHPPLFLDRVVFFVLGRFPRGNAVEKPERQPADRGGAVRAQGVAGRHGERRESLGLSGEQPRVIGHA